MAAIGRFPDRAAAGRALAAEIPPQPEGALVLGLANGGVPVAAEISRVHGLDLDAAVVRKVGHPLQPEYALGAVTEGGAVFPDDLDPELAEPAAVRARGLAQELRAGRPRAPLQARAVLLVDDGLATGRSMAAALADVQAAGASSVTIAVPVAAAPAARSLSSQVPVVAVRVVESEDFGAVGLFYDDFGHVENDAVRALLDGVE
jgi:predicted phosphoribosyltransferase